jgi:hypothetical protein
LLTSFKKVLPERVNKTEIPSKILKNFEAEHCRPEDDDDDSKLVIDSQRWLRTSQLMKIILAFKLTNKNENVSGRRQKM